MPTASIAREYAKVEGIAMPRSAATVVRLPGPLGGFSEHIHPDEVGPTNCQDCENILALPGRLKKRWGIREVDSDMGTVALHRVEGLWGGITNPSSGNQEEVIVAKMGAATNYTTGSLRYSKLSSGSWSAWSSALAGVSVNATPIVFIPIGMQLADAQRALIVADGSSRAYRIHLASTPSAEKCGIKPATADLTQTAIAGNITTDHVGTPGNVRFYLSFADENQRPTNAPTNHSGLESNTWDYGSAVELPSLGGVRLEFNDPPDGETWTHVRVYAIFISSPYVQTRAYYMGSWWHPTTGSKGTDNEIAAVEVTGDHYKIEITESTHVSQASGNGAYDYRPTRNYAPENMRYFAAWDGRGFWARDYEPNVYHTDIASPLTGGHYEALSGDYLPPVDGPVSMLAEYGDALLIGTDRGIYQVTGTIGSYTNASAARLEALPPHTAVISRTPGELGPVSEGTGSHAVADGAFYFVSRNGLARYEGPNVRPQLVGLAVQALLPTTDSASPLKNSMLAHDPVNHIIYLLVRQDVSGGKYSGDSASTDGQVESVIYAYSYRELDPRTGFGKWTLLGDIGVTAAFNGNDRRYSAVGMRHPLGDRPRLLVGMRRLDGSGDVRDGDVYQEVPGNSADEDCAVVPDDADVPWSWESGNWDLGLPERQKWIHHLSVKVKDNSGSSETLNVAESLDGATYQSSSYKENTTRIEKSIGGLAEQMSVKFSGDSQLDTEIFSYAVDAEPADVY